MQSSLWMGRHLQGFAISKSGATANMSRIRGSSLLQNTEDKGSQGKSKKKVFDLSLEKYPDAKVFGITTGMAVMKINYQLGYKPVHFSELTDDPEFWKGCQTCKNYDVLTRTERKMCLCTGMLYDPKENSKPKPFNQKVLERLKKIKQTLFLKKNNS